MTAVVCVHLHNKRRSLRGNLNMRQLLNPIFFERDTRHPDATRQRGARRRSKDRAVARRLKGQYVPLCFVDRTVYLLSWDHESRHGYWGVKEVLHAKA
jgi:hypothetical protein